MRPLAGDRPGARRIAGALFELSGDALARGVRAVTGRGASAPPAATEPSPDTGPTAAEQAARRNAAAEEAAARLDAARERLRATIVAPSDEEDPAAPA